MALGSTQPLTEVSTRSISWGQKRSVRKADNLSPSCAFVTKSGNLNFPEHSGPVQACSGTALPLYIIYIIMEQCVNHIAMGGGGTRNRLLPYIASMSSSYRFLTQCIEFRFTVAVFRRHMGRPRKEFHVRNPYFSALRKLRICCWF